MLSVPIIARVVSLIPGCKRVYSIQHCVIKFVSDFRQVDVFFKGTLIFSTNKTIFLIYSKKIKKKIYPSKNPKNTFYTIKSSLTLAY